MRRHIEWIHDNAEEYSKQDDDSEEEDIKPNLGHQGLEEAGEGGEASLQEGEAGQQEEHTEVMEASFECQDKGVKYHVVREEGEDKAERPYTCKLCGSRFKEVCGSIGCEAVRSSVCML